MIASGNHQERTGAPARSERDDAPARPPGRIITFYSYKGGTGRSMALANVAWILAGNGHRVLAIDWDLEAPGLHRYFRPFLADTELVDTPGLIDCFVHFAEAARSQSGSSPLANADESPWFYDRADLLRYSVQLDHEFPDDGLLDFVGAGQQGPTYGARVNTFQWGDFYEKLGGGIFLEAMKARLREDYDFILIDSRTGLSDTSGICTVQMPDELVVCFTLNRQSIVGSAATALSADTQRRRVDGTQGLRIWPVPTRVELAEKDRLEASRLVAREKFAAFLWHIPPLQRPEYWGGAEMLYFPYYAYEEVLATIADAPHNQASLLQAMERLASRLIGKTVVVPSVSAKEREELLLRYQSMQPEISQATVEPGRIFLSYSNADESMAFVRRIGEAVDSQFGPDTAFWSEKFPLGSSWVEALDKGMSKADVVLVIVGRKWRESQWVSRELIAANMQNKSLIPVLVDGASWNDIPEELRGRQGVILKSESFADDLERFLAGLGQAVLKLASEQRVPIDVNDPQKGQWGGRSEHAGRRITACVSESTGDWFQVDLGVDCIDGAPLEGEVEFHLHPSFHPSVVRIPVQNNRAHLNFQAWGAFTAGASADGGRTRLELNLAEMSSAPSRFRER